MVELELEGRLDTIKLDVPFDGAMQAIQGARSEGWDYVIFAPEDRMTKVAVAMDHISVIEEVSEGIGA